jgi:hypothetical protein
MQNPPALLANSLFSGTVANLVSAGVLGLLAKAERDAAPGGAGEADAGLARSTDLLDRPISRSMATSGRGSGVVGYNVQVAVDTEHHLIITHEVTNSGSDRAQLANVASQAKDVLGVDKLEAVADRGYFSGEEILACQTRASP